MKKQIGGNLSYGKANQNDWRAHKRRRCSWHECCRARGPITVDGATIIPISRVTFGFASGGSDVGAKTNKQMFGGGTGAGVSIAPIAFLVISGGNVRTIQLVEHVSPVDSAINALPDLVDRISALIKKDKPETPQE